MDSRFRRAAALAIALCALLIVFGLTGVFADASAYTTSRAGGPAKSKLSKSKVRKLAHGKHGSRRSRKTAANWRKHGQQKIDPQRAHDIQEALIRNHYLSGSPTGKWDSTSQSAMEKFQADNGWQHKTIPDSRALIKLGLGPDHQHLLNPESAMTTNPPQTHEPEKPAATDAPASDGRAASPN